MKASLGQPDPSRFFLHSFRLMAGGLTMRVQRAFTTCYFGIWCRTTKSAKLRQNKVIYNTLPEQLPAMRDRADYSCPTEFFEQNRCFHKILVPERLKLLYFFFVIICQNISSDTCAFLFFVSTFLAKFRVFVSFE